jgi:hypothetical protein
VMRKKVGGKNTSGIGILIRSRDHPYGANSNNKSNNQREGGGEYATYSCVVDINRHLDADVERNSSNYITLLEVFSCISSADTGWTQLGNLKLDLAGGGGERERERERERDREISRGPAGGTGRSFRKHRVLFQLTIPPLPLTHSASFSWLFKSSSFDFTR